MSDHPISFARRLRALAAEAPSRPAVSMGSITLDRATLIDHGERIARALDRRGLGPGSLLTIALPNSVGFIETMIGCWLAGVTPQPISARSPRLELDAIAELAGSAFVIGEATLVAQRSVISVGDLLDEGEKGEPLEDRTAISWKAPTSGGSTGRPKLILSGQPGVFDPQFGAVWRLEADDVALMPAPLYHNAPFQNAAFALLRGGEVALLPRFDAEEVLRQIEARRATWIYLVPTMMSRIQRLAEDVRRRYDLSSLRTVWHLAAPCPPWLKRAWIEWLGPRVIWEIYGATEGQAATIISGEEYLRKPGSVGKVFLGEMKVLNQDGHQLPPGEIGDIYMRPAPGQATPYHYRGAVSSPDAEGWETVGDVGLIDADGYVFLSDRRSDMILVGGANVYPAEVESALEEHPGVQSCAVIGLDDDDLGQRVHAIVQLRYPLGAEDLDQHLARRLVRYKLPRSFEFVEEPLRDDAGKVRRSQLRANRIGPPPLDLAQARPSNVKETICRRPILNEPS